MGILDRILRAGEGKKLKALQGLVPDINAQESAISALSDDALHFVADQGYDPVYGARPLKRVIQRSLQNPLAGLILEGGVKEGETVHVSADRNGLTINGKLAEAA